MKQLLILFCILVAPFSFGQVFHFVSTTTTLVKNTSQSPVHWYLEIDNDINIDTTLMWKATFYHVPAEWEVSFDAQTQSWLTVHDGDSSLFPLQVTTDFPQKMIIGVMLNDTPGSGTVYFDIFDPNYRDYHQTISYHFIISGAGLNQLEDISFGQFSENKFIINNGKPTTLECFSIDGKLLYSKRDSSEFSLEEISTGCEPVLFHITQDNQHYILKIQKN